MRILVIDQCSGNKDVSANAPQFDADSIDRFGRDELLSRDGVPAIPARDLYVGRQQQYIDSAVDRLRAAGDTVDRVFISAGFGVVSEGTELPPYEVTFTDMNAAAIDERAARLGISDDIRDRILATPAYDLLVFALGSDYYRACAIEQLVSDLPDDAFGVVFNREDLAETHANVVSIAARTAEAKEHGTIVVALKGVYLRNLADHRADGEAVESAADVRNCCTTPVTTQSGLGDYD